MSFHYIGDMTLKSVECGGDVVVLAAGGEIDYEASPHLSERIADQINEGARNVVLDLSAVTFIDSTAIGVLVGAAMRMREHAEGTLTVVCAEENRRVLRIFEIAGVEGVIAVHRSREEALLALAAAG